MNKLQAIEQQQKAIAVLKKYKKKLLAYSGVKEVGVGLIISDDKIQYNQIGILVYVSRKKPKTKLKNQDILPEELDGIKVDVIESRPKKHDILTILNERYHPLIGGISIGNFNLKGGGTLGLLIKQKNSSTIFGLTNWHVIKKRKGRRGNPIVQPSWEKNTPEFNIGNLHRWNKRLDCAIFKLNDNRSIAKTKSLLNIQGKIKQLETPYIGMPVMKSGAKTGVTYGIIASLSSNFRKIRIAPNPKKLNDEISDNGDSGSIWITDEAKKKAVALHWGGDKTSAKNKEFAVANNLKDVFDRLDLEFLD